MSKLTHCPKHPDTQTNLRCGRCEELICPRCMVHSPVGARCLECAQVRRLPTFEVTTPFLARAIVAGLVLGIAGGAAVLLLIYLFGGFLALIALIGVGYLIGEGVSVAVNRKRGQTLKYVAAGSMLVATLIISIFSGPSLLVLLAAAAAIYVAINRF